MLLFLSQGQEGISPLKLMEDKFHLKEIAEMGKRTQMDFESYWQNKTKQ